MTDPYEPTGFRPSVTWDRSVPGRLRFSCSCGGVSGNYRNDDLAPSEERERDMAIEAALDKHHHGPKPTPVLRKGRLYLAYDQYVCTECAGMTALYTGFTIGGAKLSPLRAADVAEWATYDLGPLRCEGGHLEATLGPTGRVRITRIGGQSR